MPFQGVFDSAMGQFMFPIILECAWIMFAAMRFLGRGHNDND